MQDSAEQLVDQILVLDAQNGRRAAFEVLVSRWQRRLWRYAYRLTGRSEVAWDITQESWLDVVRGLARLQDPARFGSWAHRIVGNKARDWRRRNGGRASEEAEPENMPAPAAEPEKREIVGDVQTILRRLPHESQAVLRLYYLEDFSVAEIAKILGTPTGTVKSRLHAARAAFRKCWEMLGGQAPMPVSISGKDEKHE
jgi:RNA polymerase sigma-70 factor, ECF subfamily